MCVLTANLIQYHMLQFVLHAQTHTHHTNIYINMVADLKHVGSGCYYKYKMTEVGFIHG